MAKEEYAVATVDDIPPGKVKRVDVEGRALALFNVDGEFFALSDRCPHKGAFFSLIGQEAFGGCGTMGEINEEESTIRCPFHFWEFDLTTGESVAGFNERVPTFETSVVDGKVRVRLR